jgi:hypothetical protein
MVAKKNLWLKFPIYVTDIELQMLLRWSCNVCSCGGALLSTGFVDGFQVPGEHCGFRCQGSTVAPQHRKKLWSLWSGKRKCTPNCVIPWWLSWPLVFHSGLFLKEHKQVDEASSRILEKPLTLLKVKKKLHCSVEQFPSWTIRVGGLCSTCLPHTSE